MKHLNSAAESMPDYTGITLAACMNEHTTHCSIYLTGSHCTISICQGLPQKRWRATWEQDTCSFSGRKEQFYKRAALCPTSLLIQPFPSSPLHFYFKQGGLQSKSGAACRSKGCFSTGFGASKASLRNASASIETCRCLTPFINVRLQHCQWREGAFMPHDRVFSSGSPIDGVSPALRAFDWQYS